MKQWKSVYLSSCRASICLLNCIFCLVGFEALIDIWNTFSFLLILVVRVLDFDFQYFHLFPLCDRESHRGKKWREKWLFRGKREYWMRKGNKYRNMRVLFPRELRKVETSSTWLAANVINGHGKHFYAIPGSTPLLSRAYCHQRQEIHPSSAVDIRNEADFFRKAKGIKVVFTAS